jgi:hypothetical protein
VAVPDPDVERDAVDVVDPVAAVVFVASVP